MTISSSTPSFALRAMPLIALVAGGCTVYTRPAPVYAGATVQTSAYAQPTAVRVNAPPPPLREAVIRPNRPQSGAVWVSGHWDWQGQWVWRAGEWRVPQSGYDWEEPVCVAVEGGGYQYHPGYWRPANQAPPTIYRTTGTIRVTTNPNPVVQRVAIRPGQPATGTVTVRPSRPATTTVTTRPAGGTVTTRPAGGTTTVRPSGGGTVTVRPSQPNTTVRPSGGGTVTVRPSQPNTTVRPSGGGTVTVRPTQPNTTVRPSGGGTVTVRPTQPNTTVRPSGGGTVTVRPTQPNTTVRPSGGGTVTVQPTRPNTTVRPSGGGTVTVQPTRPNTTVRPSGGGTVTAQPTRPNTTVRPSGGGTVTTQPTRPNTTVRPSGGGTVTVATARPTCRVAARAVPAGGVLVLSGSGLTNVQSVEIGTSTASIMSQNGTQVRARVDSRPGASNVTIRVGGQTISCGQVNVLNTPSR